MFSLSHHYESSMKQSNFTMRKDSGNVYTHEMPTTINVTAQVIYRIQDFHCLLFESGVYEVQQLIQLAVPTILKIKN